jgi:hypothetical protein
LPLIALQYHEVKIILDFRQASELVVGLTPAGDRDFASNTSQIVDSSGVTLQSAALWVDYVGIQNIYKDKNIYLDRHKKVLIKSQC